MDTLASLSKLLYFIKNIIIAEFASKGVAGMMGTMNNITKTIVPASAICPAPMPLHNSWVAPTTTTTPAA